MSATNQPNLLLPLLDGLAALPDLVNEIAQLRSELANLRKHVGEKPKPQKWIRLKEAAIILNTSEKTVRRYVERGFLRRNAASRHILIPAEDLEDFAKKVVV